MHVRLAKNKMEHQTLRYLIYSIISVNIPFLPQTRVTRMQITESSSNYGKVSKFMDVH